MNLTLKTGKKMFYITECDPTSLVLTVSQSPDVVCGKLDYTSLAKLRPFGVHKPINKKKNIAVNSFS